MQPFYQSVHPYLSDARMNAYTRRVPHFGDPQTPMAYYLWNTALSEALYPTIQFLELSLRNSIHIAATANYGTESWFNNDLQGPELVKWQRDKVTKAVVDLRKLDQRRSGTHAIDPPRPGRVIAELNFGFWVGLFNVEYELAKNKLWHGNMLLSVFPNLPQDDPITVRPRRTYRNPHALSTRLNRVRELRNRIMHHEPIWYWYDPPINSLNEQYQEILTLLDWINADLRTLSALMDRFPAILAGGPNHFRASLP